MYVHTGPASQQPLRLSSDGPHASLPAAPSAVGLLTWVDYDFMYYVLPFAFMPCTVDVYLQASPFASQAGLACPCYCTLDVHPTFTSTFTFAFT